jgi:methylenetetrahydrofolate reductase (NADPH)
MPQTRVTKSLNQTSRPTLSFEFFPPKDDAGKATLWSSFEQLLELNPDFISVTYGAMGSNQATSLEVVERFAPQVSTIAHLTCIGANDQSIGSLLGKYEDFGVAALLALRGDVPAGQSAPRGDFEHAIDLVNFAKGRSGLEIGVAAFPEKHPESPSFSFDAEILSKKVDAGASFGMTQLFFTAKAYFDLLERNRGVGIEIPIVPGVMPISNAKQVLRMAQMSGAAVPADLETELLNADDEHSAREVGMAFSAKLVRDLVAGGAPGVHIFTLNQSRAAIELARASGLA